MTTTNDRIGSAPEPTGPTSPSATVRGASGRGRPSSTASWIVRGATQAPARRWVPPAAAHSSSSRPGEMRRGVVSHPEFLDEGNVAELDGMDFVFIAVDDGPAKRVIVVYPARIQIAPRFWLA